MGELVSGARVPGLGLRVGPYVVATGRARGAALAAAATLGLLLFFLIVHPLKFLPDYPAVIGGALVWMIAPGWLLQRALLSDRRAGPLERLAVAFLASMGIAALPGIAALRLHWSIEAFACAYAACAAIASGVAVLSERDADAPVEDAPREAGTTALVVVVVLALFAVMTLPLWAEGRISRDFDMFGYMAYVNRYAETGTLNPSDPVLNGTSGGFGRMGVNVWVGVNALVADNAGVSAYDLLMDSLPPIMTVLAIAAVFTLVRGLFRSERLAWLSAAFALGYGAVDLGSYESFGRNLFLRIDQDKIIAAFVLLPVALLFLSRWVRRPTAGDYAACLIASAALFAVHPLGVEFLAIALVSTAGVRAFNERSAVPLRSAAVLLAPWLVPLVAALAWSIRAGDPGFEAFGSNLSLETYDAIARPGHGLIMTNFHLILHPLMLAAIAIAPLLWLRAPRSIGTQLIAAITISSLAIAFFPPAATLLEKVVSEQGVWRLPWLIPVPIVLAYACNEVLRRFDTNQDAAPFSKAFAAVGATVVVLAAALVVQEQYYRFDNGSYFLRARDTRVLPFTERSIGWGGVHYAFDSGWRPSPQIFRLAEYLEANVPLGATVTTPRSEAFLLSGQLDDDVTLVGYRSGAQYLDQLLAVVALYGGQSGDTHPADLLRGSGIDYAVLARGSFAEESLFVAARFDADSFEAQSGAPDYLPTEAYSAWALAPKGTTGVGGVLFGVPADIVRTEPSVSLVIGGVLSAPAEDGQNVRLLIQVFETRDGEIFPAPMVQWIDDIAFSAGDTAVVEGELINAQLGIDDRYAVSVIRLGDDPADTYPGDLHFLGITESYRSDRLLQVPRTGYDIYRLR